MTRLLSRFARCALLSLTSLALAHGQTNQGTDFYLGFPLNATGTLNLRLFLTGTTATTGAVEIPGIAFSGSFSVIPGTVTTVVIPVAAETNTSGVINNKGIHVTSVAPVTVYGLNQYPQSTDAYLGLPAPLLGTDHIVLAYNGTNATYPSEFQVVASQDATQVTITPSAAAAGHAAGVPYTISLDRLQTYQLQVTTSGADLTGSMISSTKPIALFAGAACANIPNISYVACDHVVEQIPATGTWGQNFLTVPLATRTGGDTFRVIARDAGTTVSVDGSVKATLGRAQFYQAVLPPTTHVITTSGPALVAQYSNSTSYDNVTSDPFMMLISPTEQFQPSYTVTTPAASPVAFTNYLSVVAQSADTASCRVDGASVTTFQAIVGTTYSGAKVPVAIGTHNLACSSPFATYTYGFASYDSYGYPGGLGIRFINNKCDVNGDGRIDTRDINLIFAARNTPASSAEDQRDADGDLTITVADARTCQQKCTIASCAVQ